MKQGRNNFLLTVLGFCVVAVMAMAGCNSPPDQQDNQNAPPAATLVTSMTISAQNVQSGHLFSGEVRGRQETALGFRVPGKIIARHVETGSLVKAGDLLMEVDPKDIREAVTAASAQASAAESQYKLAVDLLNRFQALYEQDYMSKAEIDRYQNEADSARAVLKQARAQFIQANNQLNYCKLRADENGVVLDVKAETGQVVAAGMPVVIMAKGKELEVEIFVPEKQAAHFSRDMQFYVSFWALPELEIMGRLRYMSPVADPVTRTYKTRITLIDPPDTVRLGMTASAVSSEHRADLKQIFIPLSAVYQSGDTPMVWKIIHHRVELQSIKLGEVGHDEYIQVIEGLIPGDEIVTTGVHKLSHGQEVRTQPRDKDS